MYTILSQNELFYYICLRATEQQQQQKSHFFNHVNGQCFNYSLFKGVLYSLVHTQGLARDWRQPIFPYDAVSSVPGGWITPSSPHVLQQLIS